MAQEVNSVGGYGSYSIGYSQSKKEQMPEGQVDEGLSNFAQEQKESIYNPDSLLATMGNMGAYNLISINKAETHNVNPNDYLSEERQNDIEAMMAEFEAGVDLIAQSIEDEFPGMFDSARKNALAAGIFAQE